MKSTKDERYNKRSRDLLVRLRCSAAHLLSSSVIECLGSFANRRTLCCFGVLAWVAIACANEPVDWSEGERTIATVSDTSKDLPLPNENAKDIWDQGIPSEWLPTITNMHIQELFSMMEEWSRRLEPRSRGIRIVSYGLGAMTVTCETKRHVTFRNLLDACCEPFFVAGDVAVVMNRGHRCLFRPIGVEVRVLDAENRTPVTNAWFDGGAESTTFKTIGDGRYLVAVTAITIYAGLPEGYRCIIGKPLAHVWIGAPGYQGKKLEIVSPDTITPSLPKAEVTLVKGSETNTTERLRIRIDRTTSERVLGSSR